MAQQLGVQSRQPGSRVHALRVTVADSLQQGNTSRVFSRRGGEFSRDAISPGEERDTKIGIYFLDSFQEDNLLL